MRVLGIDPGSLITGFGVVEDAAGVLCALAWGTVRTNSSQPLPVRLKHIYDGLSEALRTWQPEAVAVKRVFFADVHRATIGTLAAGSLQQGRCPVRRYRCNLRPFNRLRSGHIRPR